MVFRDLEGRLCLAIHQPNSSPDERMKIFALKDDGERIVIASGADNKQHPIFALDKRCGFMV